MSIYTSAIVEDSWGGEPVRHVMFPTYVLHAAPQQEFANRLGFTACGRMIPARALIDDEIPERFRPPMCRTCENLGLGEQR